MTASPAARAGAVLEIDLGAIIANWRLLAARAAPAQCAAVVKANAYGLGAAPVCRALAAAGCRLFFVATLDEGITLRRALGGAAQIAVLNGPLPGTAGEFVEHGLIPVLNEPGQIAQWADKPSPAPRERG
ncbi:MAG TPA: alanine racemase, partial [Stellaceae bacterium]|nr:alanine racemase [Stellaceae bacterium]